ncbi:MAG: 6-bladed beta-propeller [Longimicrobiales bacterium]
MTRRAAGVLWLSAFSLACGPQGDPELVVTVTDSAGLRILTYDLTDAAPPTYRTLGAHDLEIGLRDGPAAYVFSTIADATLTVDGGILVSDGQSRELRLFDRTGAIVRTFGGAGGGPGEFAAAPDIVGVGADSLFVYDPGNRRVTAFAMSGGAVSTTTLRSEVGGAPFEVVRLDDGSFMALTRWVDPAAPPSGPHDMRLELDSAVVQRFDSGGQVRDTLRIMPDRNRARIVQDAGAGSMRVMQAQPPLTARTFVRTDGARVVIGHSAGFAFEVRAPDGSPGTVVRVLGVDHPATGEEIRAHQEAAIRADLGDRELDPRVRRLNVDFLPERLPSFQGLIVSHDGHTWVARSELDGSAGYDWLVFGPAGDLLGRVHTPPDSRLFAVASDAILVGITDEFDVPYLRRYPLAGEAGGQ